MQVPEDEGHSLVHGHLIEKRVHVAERPSSVRRRLLELLRAGSPPPDLVRRALVEAVLHADRAKLLRTLDDSLVGLAPPPAGYFALRAAS